MVDDFSDSSDVEEACPAQYEQIDILSAVISKIDCVQTLTLAKPAIKKRNLL